MNRHEMIHRAQELGEKINSEPKFTISKMNWIVEKAQIEYELGIHNL